MHVGKGLIINTGPIGALLWATFGYVNDKSSFFHHKRGCSYSKFVRQLVTMFSKTGCKQCLWE